jgi:hypothetical protein
MVKNLYRVLFLILLFAAETRGQIAQEPKPTTFKITLHFSINWELTIAEREFYRRECTFDFDNMRYEGVYQDFKDDKLIAEGNYLHGERRGLQTEYFPDRSLKSTIEYGDGGDFTIWDMNMETGEHQVERGTGKFSIVYVYRTGLINKPVWKEGILEGEFQQGRRVGTWTYTDINKVKTDEENYERGKFLKRTHFGEGTTIDLDYKKEIFLSIYALYVENLAADATVFVELNQAFGPIGLPATYNRDVTYAGGIKRLLLLLSQAATMVEDGTLFIVGLKVDEKGVITKSIVRNSMGQDVDAQLFKLMSVHEKRFFPAIKNGVAHTSWVYIPIGRGEEWIKTIRESTVKDLLAIGKD